MMHTPKYSSSSEREEFRRWSRGDNDMSVTIPEGIPGRMDACKGHSRK